jgi:inosine-uridine nucleoside N-ribohydrolase
MTTDRLRVIFDADIGPDPTDFTTISMLHEYHERGMIELVATIGETPDPLLASTFSVYNRLHGHDVPIGAPIDGGGDLAFEERGRVAYDLTMQVVTRRNQNEVIRERYGDSSRADPAVPTPVECYRRLLAAASESDITIFAAGQLFNLPALLDSPPDEHSPLSGEELVRRSVKGLHFMGGAFPSSVDVLEPGIANVTGGAEWNFWALNMRGVTAAALGRLSALGIPMTFVGWEVGIRVLAGREIIDRLGRDHPSSEAYFQYVSTSEDGTELTDENPAYDDVALFHLVEGETGSWFGEVRGRPVIDDVGVNTWAEDGSHRYITLQPGVEAEMRALVTDRITGRFDA